MEERYPSPDGLLTLVVLYESDDITIGFEGFPWHTHGDVLAGSYLIADVPGLTPEAAARRFVDDITSSRIPILVQRSAGRIQDVWVTDDLDEALSYPQPGETIEFRYWDGSDPRKPNG